MQNAIQGLTNINSFLQSYKGSQNKFNIILTNKKHALKRRQLELLKEKNMVINDFINCVNSNGVS